MSQTILTLAIEFSRENGDELAERCQHGLNSLLQRHPDKKVVSLTSAPYKTTAYFSDASADTYNCAGILYTIALEPIPEGGEST